MRIKALSKYIGFYSFAIDSKLYGAYTKTMITDRQQQALDYIKSRKTSPTMRELGNYLGVSRQRASAIVHYLADNGYLKITKYHPRGIIKK